MVKKYKTELEVVVGVGECWFIQKVAVLGFAVEGTQMQKPVFEKKNNLFIGQTMLQKKGKQLESLQRRIEE